MFSDDTYKYVIDIYENTIFSVRDVAMIRICPERFLFEKVEIIYT